MKSLIITPTVDLSQGGSPFRFDGIKQMLSGFSDCTVFDAGALLKDAVFDKLLNCYKSTYNERLPLLENFDFVFIESLDVFSFARHFPKSKIVYDAHNIGWEMLQFDLHNSPIIKRLPFGKSLVIEWLCWRGSAFEKNALGKADAILVCSEADKQKYLAELPEIEEKIFVLPNCVNASEYSPKKTSENNIVLFFGSFAYSANLDAARIIDEKIAPKLQNAVFRIIGNKASALQTKSKNIELIDFLPIEELKGQVCKASVVIAPLRLGSGTRIKILQAFALGKAVLSTSKGAEGIEAIDGKHLLIEDDFEKFAEKISMLLKDKQLRERLGKGARKLVEEKYDWQLYSKKLQSFLLRLYEY